MLWNRRKSTERQLNYCDFMEEFCTHKIWPTYRHFCEIHVIFFSLFIVLWMISINVDNMKTIYSGLYRVLCQLLFFFIFKNCLEVHSLILSFRDVQNQKDILIFFKTITTDTFLKSIFLSEFLYTGVFLTLTGIFSRLKYSFINCSKRFISKKFSKVDFA